MRKFDFFSLSFVLIYAMKEVTLLLIFVSNPCTNS